MPVSLLCPVAVNVVLLAIPSKNEQNPIRCDYEMLFNVRLKADVSQLNQPQGTKN